MTYTGSPDSTTPASPYIPPPQPPRRHPVRKWLLIATAVFAAMIGVLVVIALAAGPAPSQHAARPAASTPAASSPVSVTDPNGLTCPALDASGYCPGDDPTASATPSGPDMLTVSQTETLSDSSNATVGTITVESATVTTRPADPSYGERPANGYYVIVHVKAAADPSYADGWDINELDFHALVRGTHYDSGNGNAYEALSDSQSNADLTSTLAAGETASGWMAFDVPSRHGEIVYAPNLDGQPVAEWSY